MLAALLSGVSALAVAAPPDRRFAWIAAIEKSGGGKTFQLKAQTYYIDRNYNLPDGTSVIGAGSRGAGTNVVAVATKPAQTCGNFHGCGPNHVNRVGFVLGSRCRIASLHYAGIERARYPDSHPMCGGAPFQTPGCATPFCENAANASWLVGSGKPVRDSVVEDITISGGTVQNAFWMPATPGTGYCTNITARNLVVTGNCAKPGPCSPAADGSGGGGTWADGVNIHGAHRGILVEGNRISHTGDDGFAIWSKGGAETGVSFVNNSCASPRYPKTWAASCFAMYGGNQSAFVNNTCVQSGQRGALYLTGGFGGTFIANVSFVSVAGNNFSACCPLAPSACGIHGPVRAPGCAKNASASWRPLL